MQQENVYDGSEENHQEIGDISEEAVPTDIEINREIDENRHVYRVFGMISRSKEKDLASFYTVAFFS